MILVIMAAGMGSRFGGLKQIEPVGPNGEFIIDYSIYDAIKAGFDKVVFIIKEENYDIFKSTIGKRIEGIIDVSYVFQDIKNIKDIIELPKDRIKPYGTCHAILCCKEVVNESFVVINADDFYGRDAFYKAAEFIKSNNLDYAVVGYKIKNTLSYNGKVKRGFCRVSNDLVIDLIESNASFDGDKILIEPLNGDNSFYAKEDDLVSMNMLCFRPDMINYIEDNFPKFFNDNKNNLEKCEYLISDALLDRIKMSEIKLRLINTDARWLGITYKEDKKLLVESIKSLIKKDEYPKKLYKQKTSK